ncbi:MAG TPA: hypothetical protein V6D22_13830 [Candidatus Obscuribacterales bacterium]
MGKLELKTKSPQVRDQLREAMEQLSEAVNAVDYVATLLVAAERLAYDDNEIDGRKIGNHLEACRSTRADIQRLQIALAERLGIETDPDCICGMSSRCKVHASDWIEE